MAKGDRRPYQSSTTDMMLDALRVPRLRLTAWEESFVQSVQVQKVKWGNLTGRQMDILTRLYNEKA